MKKILSVCLSLVLCVFLCASAAACKDKPRRADGNTVVISVPEGDAKAEGGTLKEYMDYLQSRGDFTYTLKGGMVTSINEKSNTAKSYWMLYTSDSENSNDGWGTFEYEGNSYGSAVCGAEALKIKGGCVYIWAYQTF